MHCRMNTPTLFALLALFWGWQGNARAGTALSDQEKEFNLQTAITLVELDYRTQFASEEELKVMIGAKEALMFLQGDPKRTRTINVGAGITYGRLLKRIDPRFEESNTILVFEHMVVQRPWVDQPGKKAERKNS